MTIDDLHGEDLYGDPDSTLKHYGVLQKSGRYPWGSGKTPHQRNRDFLATVEKLQRDGLSEAQIAVALGIPDPDRPSTTALRALKAIAKNEQKKAAQIEAMKLRDKGMSNVAIGQQMGIAESSVRNLLNPELQARSDRLTNTADMLRKQVDDKKYLDIGVGVEHNIGISGTQLATAVAMLREEGYTYHKIKVEQLGTGNMTELKVLAAPDTQFTDVVRNKEKIQPAGFYAEDNGSTLKAIVPPKPIDSSRVSVRWDEEGGSNMDGVIEIRRGVPDVAIGNSKYAQVRIAVDGTHYLKGMAMYADDLPDGVDMRFNTNKKKSEAGGDKMKAMKAVKEEGDNPFGTITRQMTYVDKNGKQQQSVLNIVNEEGTWATWSKNLSSQMLSKQNPALAKEQLALKYDLKKTDFDEIMSLTNPAVKKKLLEELADSADSSAAHLKAAGLPRTAQHVILPINSLKDNEIYAPGYRHGERVVLIRHPHGGTFEIPELVVNNNNKDGKRVITNKAVDAVGINAKVAERLSGADFDGDTVLVIPNNSGGPRSVKTSAPLRALKDFNPKEAYPAYEGMPKMSARSKGMQMGDVSNLITDMTIKGATPEEIARAVKHSMVVIDAEKHNLNWKQSKKDQGINELKVKYQNGANKGAATLISRASSEKEITNRKPRSAKDGGAIDPVTGRRMFVDDPQPYVNRNGETVIKKMKVKKMDLTDDAHTLVSDNGGTRMERVYADHANRMKSLANEARKASYHTPPLKVNASAKETYKPEVDSLKSKLNTALKNAPLERRAQLVANAQVKAKRDANPDMDSADLKKIKGMALTEARARVGASKQRVVITPREWEAIQAGAISNNFLESILANTDVDRVRELATPRPAGKTLSSAQLVRARSMLNSGYTQADIAQMLGVPATTLMDAVNA